MASLQHHNVVTLYDFHEDEEDLFLIMEYVDGVNLSEYLKNLLLPMDIEEAKNVFVQVLEAFDYAHSKGVVHRDAKPENILLGKDGSVKVLDFGIAKMVGDDQYNLTKTGMNVGTAYYMSPEQVEAKKVDHLSDIYSLGVVLFEMATGSLLTSR